MNRQLRIAIALAALRHKPRAQSIQAYILDLQAAFPATCPCRPCQSRTADSREAPTEPWRERALALEKELEELRTQHDAEKIELLALRKAAQSHQTTSARPTPDSDAADSTPTASAVPMTTGTGKKAKAKKGKQTAGGAVPPPAALSARQKVNLAAVLRDDFADASLPLSGSSGRLLGALDAADALVDFLSADTGPGPDSGEVSVDLILSTTLRALDAVGEVLSSLVSRCGSSGTAAGARSKTVSGPARTPATTGSAHCYAGDPTATLDTLTSFASSLLSSVIAALLAQHSAAAKQARNKKTSMKRARAARTIMSTSAAAIDDILGRVYETILAPAVRAFAPLSQGFLVACLAGDSGRASDPANPGKKTPRTGDAPSSGPGLAEPDLRPDIFALLESMLGTLDDALAGADVVPTCAAERPPAGKAAVIPGTDHVRTLLALECVRELEKLYLPHPDEPCGSASASGPTVDTHTGAQPRPATTSDSSAQAYPRADADPAASRVSPPGDCASSSAALAARPGTARVVHPAMGCGPPRAAANLGETYSGASSGPARGPVPTRVLVRDEADLEIADAENFRAGADSSAGAGMAEHGKAKSTRKRTRGEEGEVEGTDAVGARITKLARKDTVWWLCAVLDLVLPALSSGSRSDSRTGVVLTDRGLASTPPASAGSMAPASTPAMRTTGLDIAHEAVYTALADLLRRTRPRSFLAIPARVATPSSPHPHPHPSSASPRGHSSESCASIDSASTQNHAGVGKRQEAIADSTDGLREGRGGQADAEMRAGVGGKSKLGKTGEKAGTRGEEMRPGEGERDRHAGSRVRVRSRMRVDGEVAMGEVERGMLLAVLERAWLGV
ncbi:hypothetical protein OH77DRAFT_631555 [Trametes cingulata]|nr:hypothetical protein OH77DRAFT_631555 [Trametes cingulata]